MTNLPALALAPAAQAWLAETSTARVLNVFDRACNLVNPRGDVLAVVTSQRGLTPFALVVAGSDPAPFRAVTESSDVRVQASRLRLGPLDIDFSAARLWDPAPDWPAIRRLFARVGQLDELAAMAFGHGPAGSLLELFAPEGHESSLPDALRGRALPSARALVMGMRSGSADDAVAGASRLAGLGGGLTPAGDDFVLGVLLAAWAGLYGPGAERLGGKIAEAAAPLTTSLSGAYLRAAARGECSDYWHRLFAALLGSDAAGLRAALSALLAVGHTSGADALAGFLAGHLTVPQPPVSSQLQS
jgi:hypothetical protein